MSYNYVVHFVKDNTLKYLYYYYMLNIVKNTNWQKSKMVQLLKTTLKMNIKNIK